jgi:hypothetical protein
MLVLKVLPGSLLVLKLFVFQILRPEGNTEVWKSVTHGWLVLVKSTFGGTILAAVGSNLQSQAPGWSLQD